MVKRVGDTHSGEVVANGRVANSLDVLKPIAEL